MGLDERMGRPLFILRLEQAKSDAVTFKKALDMEHRIDLLCNKMKAYFQFPKRRTRIIHLDYKQKEWRYWASDRKAC